MGGGWGGGRGGSGGGVRVGWGGVCVCVYGLEFAVGDEVIVDTTLRDRLLTGNSKAVRALHNSFYFKK